MLAPVDPESFATALNPSATWLYVGNRRRDSRACSVAPQPGFCMQRYLRPSRRARQHNVPV